MLDSRLSPGEAAVAADFCVGVDLNSATVIAALAGHRAIHLDYLRVHASPFSEWATFHHAGPDRLVFDDPEVLWDSLNRYFDQPGSEPGLGVTDDKLLQEIDAFRDGRAGERIGQYLQWYLEGLDQGKERDIALTEANHRYAEKWGREAWIGGLTSVPNHDSLAVGAH